MFNALIFICFISIAFEGSFAENKCKNLNLVFFIDSSEMDLNHFYKVKHILLNYVDELYELKRERRDTMIYLSFISYSSTINYWQSFVSIDYKDYLNDVIKHHIPKLNGKCFLKDALSDLYELYINGKESLKHDKNVLITITKNQDNIVDSFEWGYEAQLIKIATKLSDFGFESYLILPESIVNGRDYMNTDPKCAYQLYFNEPNNIKNGIETLKNSLCSTSLTSKSCTIFQGKIPCLLGVENRLRYVVCDSFFQESTNLNFYNEQDLMEQNRNMFVNLAYFQIINFNLTMFESNYLEATANTILILKLNKNRFVYLRTGMFHKFSNLDNLFLSYNQIEVIEKDTFMNLNKLTLLDLHENNLKSINKTNFENLESLVTLLINYNKLEVIDPDAFTGLKNLSLILLENNRIKHLSEHLFRFNENLAVLDISRNQLEDLEDGIFRNSRKINCIVMVGNKLRTIRSSLFKNLTKMKWLFLNDNQLKSIDGDAFKDYEYLEWLDMNNNSLSSDFLPVLNSKYLRRLDLTNQNNLFTKIDKSFESKFINVNYSLDLVLNENEFNLNVTDLNESNILKSNNYNTSRLKIHLSIKTFMRIISKDVCNLRYFHIRNGFTIIFLDDLTIKSETFNKKAAINQLMWWNSIRSNCELRLAMAKYNIFISKIIFPPFGLNCGYKKKNKLNC